MLGIFLDLETTGLDSFIHRVIEIALRICDLNSGEELASYQRIVRHTISVWKQSDPESLKINGFNPDLAHTGLREDQVRSEIKSIFQSLGISRGKAVFICQNPSFDRAFFSQIIPAYTQENLQWPYHWLDLASMYWARQMDEGWRNQGIPTEVNFSKNHIAKQYGLPNEELPHRAMNGVDHLITCYRAVVGFPKKVV